MPNNDLKQVFIKYYYVNKAFYGENAFYYFIFTQPHAYK